MDSTPSPPSLPPPPAATAVYSASELAFLLDGAAKYVEGFGSGEEGQPVAVPESVTERYYRSIDSGTVLYLVHSNHLILLCLSPKHPIFSENEMDPGNIQV